MSRAAWHDEARALYRDGVSVPDIARRFGKQSSQVRYIVDEEYHEHRRRQVQAARGRMDGRDPSRINTDLRRKQKAKPATPPIDTLALCRAFARGEFDRAELKRRLGGEA